TGRSACCPMVRFPIGSTECYNPLGLVPTSRAGVGMRARIGAFVVFLTLVAWLPPAAAQQAPASGNPTPPAPVQPKRTDGTRPRVGLALGGGSARGLAHIGVLEWFEQHRI